MNAFGYGELELDQGGAPAIPGGVFRGSFELLCRFIHWQALLSIGFLVSIYRPLP